MQTAWGSGVGRRFRSSASQPGSASGSSAQASAASVASRVGSGPAAACASQAASAAQQLSLVADEDTGWWECRAGCAAEERAGPKERRPRAEAEQAARDACARGGGDLGVDEEARRRAAAAARAFSASRSASSAESCAHRQPTRTRCARSRRDAPPSRERGAQSASSGAHAARV